MSQPRLQVHSSENFPIVEWDSASIYPGYATAWCSDMDDLLKQDRPFVLIYSGGDGNETSSDRMLRGTWLREHKSIMAHRLLALIHVEPDLQKRQMLEEMLPKLVSAFGTSQAARADKAEAIALAHSVLATGRL